MRVSAVRAHVLRHRLPPEERFSSAFSTFTDRWACLVEVETDEGITGWGECLGPAPVNAAIVASMAELVVGRDPLDTGPIWHDLYAQWRDGGQRGATVAAQSGIDIALWDVAGRALGQPVHRLLGGAHRLEVPAYATGGFRPEGRDRLEAVAEEAGRHAAEGFGAVKIKIGFGMEEDLAVIAAVRAAIGEARLMIDANHGFDAVEAVALGRRAAEHAVDWFEEPVVPEALGAYARVRAGQPIPVAGGETWHGRLAHWQALEAGAVDILQPDVAGCGGLTEFTKIAALADMAGVRVVPHVWGTGVAVAAALHALAALPPQPGRHAPREPWLEFDRTPHPYRMAVIAEPIEHRGGRVAVPRAPGLGIRVDRGALAAFAA